MSRSKHDKRRPGNSRHRGNSNRSATSTTTDSNDSVFEFFAETDDADNSAFGQLGIELDDVKTPPSGGAKRRRTISKLKPNAGLKSDEPLSKAQGYKKPIDAPAPSMRGKPVREENKSRTNVLESFQRPVVPRKRDSGAHQDPKRRNERLYDNNVRQSPAKHRAEIFAKINTDNQRKRHQPQEIVDIPDDDDDEVQHVAASSSPEEESLGGLDNAYSDTLHNLKKDREPGSEHVPLSIDDDEVEEISFPSRKKNVKHSASRSAKRRDQDDEDDPISQDDDEEERRKGRKKKQRVKQPVQKSYLSTCVDNSGSVTAKRKAKRRRIEESESEEEISVYSKGDTKKEKQASYTSRKAAAVESKSKVLDLDLSPSVASVSSPEGYKDFPSVNAIRGSRSNKYDDDDDDDDDRAHRVQVKSKKFPNLEYANGLKRTREMTGGVADSPESIKGGICQNIMEDGASNNHESIENVVEDVLANQTSESVADRALSQTTERSYHSVFGKTQTKSLESSRVPRKKGVVAKASPSNSFSISKKNGMQGHIKNTFAGKPKTKGKPLNVTSTSGSRTSLFSGDSWKLEKRDPIKDPDAAWEDESWRNRSGQKSKRGGKSQEGKSHSSHGADNPIEIADSDDEDDDEDLDIPLTELADESKRKSPRYFREIKLARVTLGERYSQWNCVLQLMKDKMMLKYEIRSENQENGISKMLAKHEIDVGDIRIFQHHIRANEFVLAIFRIEPTEKNGLNKIKKHYLQDNTVTDKDVRSRKAYIIFELRSQTDLQDTLIEWLRGQPQAKPFVDGVEGIDEAACQEFSQVMEGFIEKDKKDREQSVTSPRKRRRSRRSGKTQTRTQNEIQLVFPFGADEEEIDRAAVGLSEARLVTVQSTDSDPKTDHSNMPLQDMETGDLPVIRPACSDLESVKEAQDNAASSGATTDVTDDSGSDEKVGKEESTDPKEATTKTKGRAHYLTIRDEDLDRLEPGEFLNDTLLDFWMQWMMRKEDRETSPLHVFTSHFYTTLSEDGTAAVETWTAKKNIDIFTKKFIFIPINKHLHWSLCVVVNPGNIVASNAILGNIDEDIEEQLEQPVSCILFLDSLKAHQRKTVFKHVKKWLNSEWKRLKKPSPESEPDPFNSNFLHIVSPRIPYQDNSWDCGVFVCRYAYAIYMRRHRYLQVQDRLDYFNTEIEISPEFNFDMDDIRRLRREMKKLVTNLSTLYKAWNNEEIAKKKRAREKKAKASTTSALEAEKNVEGPLKAGDENVPPNGAHKTTLTESVDVTHGKPESISTALKASAETSDAETQSEKLDQSNKEDKKEAAAKAGLTMKVQKNCEINEDQMNKVKASAFASITATAAVPMKSYENEGRDGCASPEVVLSSDMIRI